MPRAPLILGQKTWYFWYVLSQNVCLWTNAGWRYFWVTAGVLLRLVWCIIWLDSSFCLLKVLSKGSGLAWYLANRLDFFGFILFILCIRKNLKRLKHFLDLGWDVTGVGIVHHLARFIFPTIESSIKWPELAWYLANRLPFLRVHPFHIMH